MTEKSTGSIVVLPLDQIVADPDQPRRNWRHDDGYRRLAELTASIAEFGMLQPLLVRALAPRADGTPQYMLIAGARRRAAAQQAGLREVPAVVRADESERLRIIQLMENLHRHDLAPLDEARAYQELIDMGGQTPTAVAAVLHVSPQQVRDRLRLLANQRLSDAVERRQISASVAREITKLEASVAGPLYARVASGERLHMADIVHARAAGQAAGVRHPRDKGGRRAPEQTVFVLPPAAREDGAIARDPTVAASVPARGAPRTAVQEAATPALEAAGHTAHAPRVGGPHGVAGASTRPAATAPQPPREGHDAAAVPTGGAVSHQAPVHTPPALALDSGVHARVVALLQRPEAATLRFELRALLRLPDPTGAVMAAITAGVREPGGEHGQPRRPRL